MNAISKGLLIIFTLTSSIASADFLGEADDSYLGVQMTMPLDFESSGIVICTPRSLSSASPKKSALAIALDSANMTSNPLDIAFIF